MKLTKMIQSGVALLLLTISLTGSLNGIASAQAILSNHLDVFATAPVSGKAKNLGVAAGIRLGKTNGPALVPLVNFTAVRNKYFAEPGVAVVFPVGKKADLGFAEIARPGSDLSLRRGRYEPSVTLGIRF